MAPSFSALRIRRQEKPAGHGLDHRYGDAGISAANEGATWVEWARASPEPDSEPEELSPVTHQPERPEIREESKALITITINLPWQKKSRRASSLPPITRRQISSPTAPPTTQPSRVSNEIPRSRVASPVPDSGPEFSPKPQSSRSRSASAPKKPSSPNHSGTPALSILSPLTESFDYPETPATTTSDLLTSIENSPSSPFKQTAFDDGVVGLHRYRPPSSEIDRKYTKSVPANYSRQQQSRSPDLGRRTPSSSHRVVPKQNPTFQSIGRYSPPPSQAYSRRARSVEPTMHRRRKSDDDRYDSRLRRRSSYRTSDSSSSSDEEDRRSDLELEGWPLPNKPLGQVVGRNSPRPSPANRPQTASPHLNAASPQLTQGTYKDIKNDYSGIRRVIDADYSHPSDHHVHQNAALTSHPPQVERLQMPRAASKKAVATITSVSKSPPLSAAPPASIRPRRSGSHTAGGRGSQPSSAGSGVSMAGSDEGYYTAGDKEVNAGPQVLVPNGEDLWG